MSVAAGPPDTTVQAIMRAGVVSVLPALTALTVIGIAGLALDGSAVVLVAACALAAMFAGHALLARTAIGAAMRSERERLVATLDATERRARDVARYGPVAAGFCVLVVTDTGSSTGVGSGALAIVAIFPFAQLAFAVWLHGRRDEFHTRRGRSGIGSGTTRRAPRRRRETTWDSRLCTSRSSGPTARSCATTTASCSAGRSTPTTR